MAELKVTITGGRKNLGEEMTVALDGPVIVGRSHSADIRFSNEEADVSGKHLELDIEDGQLWVRNLKRDVKVNGAVLATGERRPVKSGDSFEIGTRARFRVDSVAGVHDAGADSPSSATGVTRAMTEGTFAMATETVATRVATETEATRLADAANLPDASDETVALGLADDLPGDERPTEAITGEGVTTTGSAASTGGGETIALGGKDGETNKIPQWLLDDLNKKQRQKEAQKRRVRQSLLAVAVIVFAGVLGGIVYARWPKAERTATVPVIAGSDNPDIELYAVSDIRGKKLMTVDYPRDGRMKKSVLEGGRGIEVMTYTGRDRSIPFRLRISQSASADELSRSLAESAAVKLAAAERTGFVFRSPLEFPAGVYFFEEVYPGSCPSPRLLRGSPFYRSEYEIVRAGVKWHGVLIVFRDGDRAYTLQREVVESEWERSKNLLRTDPNIGFAAEFLRERWESPGQDGFIRGQDAARLRARVVRELDMPAPRTASWPRLKRELDTLVAMSWAKTDARRDALALLGRFRKIQDAKYVEFRNEFELALKAGRDGTARMESVRADCQRVFGVDASDRRFLLINNPENWSCLIEH